MPEASQKDYGRHILEQLLLLRAAGAFEAKESAPGRGVWNWRFRAGGWPVDVVLDENVLEMRVYHARDEVAMCRIPEPALRVLLGRAPAPQAGGALPSADETLAALRAIVAGWKAGNARIFIQPPVTVGHPDTWNRA
jgi:hypothetical protein